MGEPHVISALRDKRAEISGEILKLEKELGQRRAELMHLDATLRLFAPDLAPQSIRPRRRTGRNNAWFGKGERSRLVFSLLRTVERALTTREITELLMAGRNIDLSDTRARDAVHKTVLALLNGGKAKGFIQRIEGDPGEAVSWRITPVITRPCGNAASNRRSQQTADC
jgi:hypothetical protein